LRFINDLCATLLWANSTTLYDATHASGEAKTC
jgi:hypothetical protein